MGRLVQKWFSSLKTLHLLEELEGVAGEKDEDEFVLELAKEG